MYAIGRYAPKGSMLVMLIDNDRRYNQSVTLHTASISSYSYSRSSHSMYGRCIVRADLNSPHKVECSMQYNLSDHQITNRGRKCRFGSSKRGWCKTPCHYHRTRPAQMRKAGPSKHFVNKSAIFVFVSSHASRITFAATASRTR
jgi:hypothetical protein